MKFQEYKFRIECVKGEDNVADGVSRIFSIAKTVARIVSELSCETKARILKEYLLLSGHGSSNTMKFLLKGRCTWDGIYKEIDALIDSCTTCLKSGRKIVNTKNRVILKKKQNELWEVDLIVRIPGYNINSFILVAINHYSKWIETKTLSNKSGDKVAKGIEEIIIKKHGTPEGILSDCGLEF
ncbi:Pol polyprotein [Nosema granulosis]|uniref:Pol polyprotein n=1 Tax=Nosema granulosis TaxID=83296 RepID=A0A9P6H1Z1_9MICR|nr:Pol polyprotein [Nosema granulosis]